MGLLHPAYKLTIGDRIVDTTDEPQASTVVSIVVDLDMDTPADRFALMLGQVGGFQPVKDDDARIELGFRDDELVQVMVGKVISTESGLTDRRLVGYSPVQTLLDTFINETYESRTAGQIVSALADHAGVTVARADDGISFPAYVIDDRISIDHHMRELADLCGFDVYIDADGELVFSKFQRANAIHIFDYGKQIVELVVLETQPAAGEVQAWGESPGGAQAEEAWAWLTKDFSGLRGSVGLGEPILLLERPVLRTAEAAQTAAQAAATHLERQTLRGELLSTGQPKVKLGDAIQLRNVPDDHLNEMFQVRSVRHVLDKFEGFTTRIGFRSITA